MNAAHPADMSLTRLLRGLWVHLERRRQWQTVAVTVLMVSGAFAEVITLGTVVPFIMVLIEPGRVMTMGPVAQVAEWVGIRSAEDLVVPLAGAFVSAALTAVGIRLLVVWATTRLAMVTGAELAVKAFEISLYQPYQVHVRRHSSEVTSGVIQKVEAVVAGMLAPLQTAFGSIITVLSVTTALVAIDSEVAVATVAVFAFGYLVTTKAFKGRLLQNGRVIASGQTQVMKILQESIGGIREVLIDGTQQVFVDQFRDSDGRLRRAQTSNSVIQQAPRILMEGLAIVLVVTLVLILDQREGSIAANLPVLGAFVLGGQRLLPLGQQCYATVATVLGNKPVLSEALSLLDDSFDEVERFHTDRPADFESVLECVDLVFRYEESEPLVLDGVHLRIEKGATVGLVGETGSGKSTLLDLLMGLLRPTTGSVMLDSSPLEGNAVGAWRRAIAHVPQDIYLADASIAQNIAFGVPDRQIDMNQVRESARLAHVDEFVEEEALQYETRVGERGIRLSGGQKQRIGIARALYKGVSVLILDEATSALDSVTERSVMEGIASSGEGITVIMVAHRLTTLLDCDRIFEMRDGKIIAEGRFEDLMKHSVSFRELARSLPEAN